MAKGFEFWGNGEGKNEETTTPNVAAGNRSDYPGGENPADMSGAAVPGKRDSIEMPMGVDLPNKTASKNQQGISATDIPSV